MPCSLSDSSPHIGHSAVIENMQSHVDRIGARLFNGISAHRQNCYFFNLMRLFAFCFAYTAIIQLRLSARLRQFPLSVSSFADSSVPIYIAL